MGLKITQAFCYLRFKTFDGAEYSVETPSWMKQIMMEWDNGINPPPFEFDIYMRGDIPILIGDRRDSVDNYIIIECGSKDDITSNEDGEYYIILDTTDVHEYSAGD